MTSFGGGGKHGPVEARKPYGIETLTEIAVRVFAERGYDAASMDDVARAAGITKAGIYHHVASKEALLERGLKRALDALFEVLSQPPALASAPGERVRFIVRRVAELALSLQPELSVLFRIRGNSQVERAAIERRRAFDRHVAGLLAQAQAAGEMRSDFDASLATRLIFGMSNSVVEWYRAEGAFADREIAEAVVALVFDGLVPRT
jgi:AcrR family transcriptional regulator